MLPPVGVEPETNDFLALHTTMLANFLFAGSLRSSDPYVVLLYWFLDKEIILKRETGTMCHLLEDYHVKVVPQTQYWKIM